MEYIINWATIKGGHKGFEELAVRYVQFEYDEQFERTKDTRDGNKDARLAKNRSEADYTIVLGFRKADNTQEEWWMEAKYSDAEKRLTRYRLDPTLVSAILKGVVGRIIFVTNINVDTQTINDIRQAITISTDCKEVDFCTRGRLEYWLYQHKCVLQEFFSDYSGHAVQLPELVLVEPMDFYTADRSALVFREPPYAGDGTCLSCKVFNILKSIERSIDSVSWRAKRDYGYQSEKADVATGNQ